MPLATKPLTSDIGIRLTDVDQDYYKDLSVSGHYVGLEVRKESNYFAGVTTTVNPESDHIVLWKGKQVFEYLDCTDTNPYVYSDENHKDLVQAYHLSTVTYKHLVSPFVGLTIGYMRARVVGKDKSGLVFSEICGYENFDLFGKGVDYDCDDRASPYLINSINGVNWVIGSPEYPLDPQRISNKGIRIAGVKKNSPPSRNIVIHAYPDLRLDLDQSASRATTLIQYNR